MNNNPDLMVVTHKVNLKQLWVYLATSIITISNNGAVHDSIADVI